MSNSAIDIISDLQGRELIVQLAGGEDLTSHLNGASRTVYCGFDPSAESLHIGSMVPLLALKRFQMAGHKPIVLVGGATGMIGDPSFKDSERALSSTDVVSDRVERLKPQLSQFLDFDCGDNSAVLVNNLDWTQNYDVLSFLRDVGKHFSVNAMIQKESVKQRIEREGEGISFTEFSYMILQSYDFAELNKRYNCTVQIGGSDQWGNITGGIDLTRRMNQQQVYGATLPLVTKADGSKFGKSESGTIWMDGKKTSPYAFYQFWLNTADADVYNYLKYFTFLSPAEIEEIQRSDEAAAARPEAQGILAKSVTELVHGNTGLEAASRISQALFSGDIASLTDDDLQQLELDGLPCSTVEKGAEGIIEVLVATDLAKSNKMAREFIGNNAVSVNGQTVESQDLTLSADNALSGKYFVLKRGKKLFHLAKLS
ncbi:MAG: tyrosine--tRNA ligase [Gammaproteobacteria bacterium]|jgi:tyrosyl-tRNA synthetase|nr:tyrosine--tRNA ligase [Gammaproteobacteria bacterium]MBT3861151.1 tyrosine--tRNA ligase [Gammaproteobacteria bacterium]MBT3988018.1 tyrosine--tRNA ligase [Gammaproteobacteria bacterium]MBT4580812.1 tyrosine--tRNA ligase [Gammaproteobacteria bacterium]MBT4660135.1 tyrosine--tRNA ligase [Gammaproteobacteria bacterium]